MAALLGYERAVPMLFNTLAYAKFFAVVFAASWALARWKRAHVLFLLVASFAFYCGWDWRFLPVLVVSATIDFWLAARIDREHRPHARKVWLVATVALNLGLLGFFKYAAFTLDTLGTLARAVGASVRFPSVDIPLPIAISFFTFESMSYVIDVYRGTLPAYRSLPRYLLFVAFFPHMVAGPIVRPRDLLPQLERGPERSDDLASRGLFRVALGLAKKVVLADYVAGNLVNRVFDRPFEYSSVEVLVAVYAFATQIYCDFSGYTDIAIGSAELLGYRLPENFVAPYRSQSLREFWRRWHVSLSTWLRDYLYVSLGGSRGGFWFTCRNLMVTMLLGGLWHGASWTFVAWGFLHGAALVGERVVDRLRGRGEREAGAGSPLGAAVRVLATFHVVCFAWIFFRAESFAKAWTILRRLAEGTTHAANVTPALAVAIAAGIALQWLPERWYERAREGFVRAPAFAQGFALFGLALVLRETASAKPVPFLYFQF